MKPQRNLEIVIIVLSYKKPVRVEISQRRHHGNVYFIIQHFTAEHELKYLKIDENPLDPISFCHPHNKLVCMKRVRNTEIKEKKAMHRKNKIDNKRISSINASANQLNADK